MPKLERYHLFCWQQKIPLPLKNPQKAKRKAALNSEASYEEVQIEGKIAINRANRENVIGRLLSLDE